MFPVQISRARLLAYDVAGCVRAIRVIRKEYQRLVVNICLTQVLIWDDFIFLQLEFNQL